jgi:hypothetical protein
MTARRACPSLRTPLWTTSGGNKRKSTGIGKKNLAAAFTEASRPLHHPLAVGIKSLARLDGLSLKAAINTRNGPNWAKLSPIHLRAPVAGDDRAQRRARHERGGRPTGALMTEPLWCESRARVRALRRAFEDEKSHKIHFLSGQAGQSAGHCPGISGTGQRDIWGLAHVVRHPACPACSDARF